MANVIETEVVHDQGIPVRLPKLGRQVASHVIVDLSEILQEKKEQYLA